MKRRMWFFVAAVLAVIAGCTNATWSSGDRVLVAKLGYESGLETPRRFDVVVFKYPQGPIDKNVPKNYIKRLLGLPGEILAIFFGRLYRMPAPAPGAPPHFDDVDNPKINQLDLWTHPRSDDPKCRELFQTGQFEPIRKPPDVLLAMRRIVYDNDFPAKDLVGEAWKRWKPSEAAGSAWTDTQGIANSGAVGDRVDWLRYHHVLRPQEGEPVAGHRARPQLITDFLDYNSATHEGRGFNWVGDLMLECKLDVIKADGEFRMELSKGINRFQARWDLTSGKCSLFQITDGTDKKEKFLADADTRIKAPGTYQVRFANIDSRLTVWVDRELPFESGHAYAPPEVRGKDEKDLDEVALQARRGPRENDLQPASLGSKGASVQIHGLRLWRDTYYTLSAEKSSDDTVDRRDAWHGANLSDPSTWGDVRKLDIRTLYVQPGHYLCLGDNSPASADSRQWGLVPQRLMLGRALAVYFPFQRAGLIR